APTAVDAYTQALDKMDQQQQAIKDWQKILTDQEGAWTSWADSSVDSLEKVMMGTERMGSAVKSIFLGLAQTILSAALFDPVKDNINAGIRNLISGQPGSSFGGIFTNVLSGSI